MENVLKLNLKKDVFESVKTGGVSELTFETTPFYFSRFTTNKNNTVEDIKNDSSLYKSFSSVDFACSGDIYTGLNPKLDVVETLDGHVFKLSFEHPIVDEGFDDEISDDEYTETEDVVPEETKEDEVEESVEEYIEKDEEQVRQELLDKILEEKRSEIEDLEKSFREVFKKITDKNNVHLINHNIIHLEYMGKISGCDVKLPCRNEHSYNIYMNVIGFEYTDMNDLFEKLDKLTSSPYVFITEKDMVLTENKLIIQIKKLNKFELTKYM